MAARLILNADDFGLTRGVNRAVEELHAAGVLSSATLMANGTAFDDAVAIAKKLPTLGVGCHVVLVDGAPVSAPASIPTLLGRDGKQFRASLLDFAKALLLGDISEDEIERETLAQIKKLELAGINITHLDTHKHTHMFPGVARPLLRLISKASIPAIRNPFEQTWSMRLSEAPAMRRVQQRLVNRFAPGFLKLSAQAIKPDAAVGVAATGTLDATTLEALLTRLPSDGVYELVCHPGYNDAALDVVTTRLRNSREVEREALLNVVPKIKSLPGAPQIIHYGSLGVSD